MRKNTILSLFLVFVLLVNICSKTIAFATNESEKKRNVADIITDIDFTYKGYDKENKQIERWVEFQINVHWTATDYASRLQQGDYFEIIFPENIHLTPVPEHETGIVLSKNIDGIEYHIATLYLEAAGKNFLQKMVVIFHEDVKKLHELRGTIHAFATFPNTDIIKVNEDNIFPISIEGREPITKTYYLNYTPRNVKNEIITKWEELHRSDRKNRSFGWFARVNVAKRNLQGATIIDRLQTPGSYFDSDREVILSYQGFNEIGERIHLDTNGQRLIDGADYDLSYSADKTEMRIHIKSDALNGKSASLEYWTKYGEKINYIKNHIQVRMGDILIQEMENNKTAESEFEVYGIGGITATIDGTDKGLLFIEKVDSEKKTLLNGATFELKKDNILIAELITGAHNNGQVYSDKLSPGDYTLQETKAPKGYLLDETVIPITIRVGEVTKQVVENKKDLEETASITILTTDDSNNPLNNAEFTIFKDGTIVDKMVTGLSSEQGFAVSKKLFPGRYTIEETKSPEGFLPPDETIVIELDRNEQKKLVLINKSISSDTKDSPDQAETDNPNKDTPKVETDPTAPSTETMPESTPSENYNLGGNVEVSYNNSISPVRPDPAGVLNAKKDSEEFVSEAQNEDKEEKHTEKLNQEYSNEEYLINKDHYAALEKNVLETSAISSDNVALYGREQLSPKSRKEEDLIFSNNIPQSDKEKDVKSIKKIASTPKTGVNVRSFDIGIAILMLISLGHIAIKSKEL